MERWESIGGGARARSRSCREVRESLSLIGDGTDGWTDAKEAGQISTLWSTLIQDLTGNVLLEKLVVGPMAVVVVVVLVAAVVVKA
jgi:hypothetical protein